MAEKYQTFAQKSTRKFEVLGSEGPGDKCAAAAGRGVGRPAAGGRASDRIAGLKIIQAMIEDEVTRRVG